MKDEAYKMTRQSVDPICEGLNAWGTKIFLFNKNRRLTQLL